MSKAWLMPLWLLIGCQDTGTRCMSLYVAQLQRQSALDGVAVFQALGRYEPAVYADSIRSARATLDSVPDLRPSDSLWSQEHCWNGKPRDA